MAWASPTTVNASAGMDSFLPYLSTVTNFWFGRMLIIAIFVIFMFGYMRAKDDFIGGLAVSSYVTFVLSLILWVVGVVTGLDFGIVIGVTIVASVLLFTRKDQY
jgi:hypothetical protein